MKLKNIVGALLLMVVSQSVMAIGVSIQNNYDHSVEIDPVWSGSPSGYVSLGKKEKKYYRTGIHHLKGLRVKYLNGACYYYNFEQKHIPTLRGSGDILIFTAPEGKDITVSGYTDMVIRDKFIETVAAQKMATCDY